MVKAQVNVAKAQNFVAKNAGLTKQNGGNNGNGGNPSAVQSAYTKGGTIDVQRNGVTKKATIADVNKPQKIYSSNSPLARYRQFHDELYDYMASGSPQMMGLRDYRMRANRYAASAKTEDERNQYLFLANDIDNFVNSEYRKQLDSLARIEARHEKNLKDLENAAKSAADVVNFWDDPYGLYKNDYIKAKSNADTLQSRYSSQKKAYDDTVAERAKLEDEYREYNMTPEEYAAKKRLESNSYLDPTSFRYSAMGAHEYYDATQNAKKAQKEAEKAKAAGNTEEEEKQNKNVEFWKNQAENALANADKKREMLGIGKKAGDQATMDAFNDNLGIRTQYYNFEDREKAAVRSGLKQVKGDIEGAVGTGMKMLEGYSEIQSRQNIDQVFGVGSYERFKEGADIIANGKRETINGLIVPKSEEIQTLQQKAAEEATKGGNPDPTQFSAIRELEKNADAWIKSADAMQAEVDRLIARNAELDAMATSTKSEEVWRLAQEKDENLAKIKQLEKDIKDSRNVAEQYGGSRASLSYAFSHGTYGDVAHVFDQMAWEDGDAAAEELRKATEKAGKAEKALAHMTKSGIEMGFDAVVGAATGTNGLLPMAVRVFGNASQKANRQGAPLSKQVLYGAAVTGIEVFTEKMFSLGGGLIYGKGFSEDVGRALIHKLNASPFWEKAMYAVADSVGESLEEGASSLLGGLAELILERNPDNSFWEDLSRLEAESCADILYEMIIGGLMGMTGAGAGVVTGQYNAQLQQQYGKDIYSDLARNTADMLKASEQANATRAKPDSAAGKYLYGKEARTSNQETHDINKILKNPKALSEFERATDQTVEGETFNEKRESVRQIKDSGETAASKIINKAYEETTSKNTPISKAIDKHRHGEQLTKHEANLLYAAGLISRAERDQINLTAPSYIDENGPAKSNIYNSALGWKGRNQDAYIAANEQSVARKAAEAGSMPKDQAEQKAYQDNADKIHNAVEASNANAQQEVDKRDTMEMRSEGVLQDGTKRELILRRSEETGEWIVGYQNNYNPDLSKSFAFKDLKSAVQRYHEIEDGFTTKTEVPSERPTVAPQAQEDSGDTDIAPAPAEEVKPAKESTTEKAEENPAPEAQKPAPQPAQQTQPGKGATKEERAKYWQQKNEERKARNEERRLADNAEIEKAEADKTDVSFEITMFGRPHTVIYDGDSKTYVVHDQNGKQVLFIDNKGNTVKSARGGFEKWLNKYRRDTGSTQTAGPAIEAVAEEQTTPEPAQPAEESETAKAIRNATSLEELQQMFFDAPDDFASAYEEIMGEKLPTDDTADAIYRLYQTKEISNQTDTQDQSDTQAVGEPMGTQTVDQNANKPVDTEAQKKAAKDQLIEKVKAWIANPTEADVLDAESIKLARDNNIDVYEIWNDDNSKLIGYGVDDDTFTLPEQDVKPNPVKEPEKTAKQKPAKEPVSYDELMGGEVEWSRIDKYDPEYARFIADVFGENKNGEVTKVDMNHSPRQYKQALAKLEAQKTGETTAATTTAKTAENLAKQLADGLIENSQTASIVLTILDDDSDISTLYDDKIADAFAKSPTGLVKQAFLQGLADRGIAAPGQNGINLLDYYDQLSPAAKEKVKSYVAGQLENYRTNLWAERKAANKKNARALALEETTETEGEQTNDTTGRRFQRRGICSADEDVTRNAFERRGEESDSTTAARAFSRWRETKRQYEKQGARVITNVSEAHQAYANALLDGMPGDERSKIPFITYIDCSTAKASIKLAGMVLNDSPESGLFVFVNNDTLLAKSGVKPSVVYLHEPVHYFLGLEDKANKGNAHRQTAFFHVSDAIAETFGVDPDLIDKLLLNKQLMFASRSELGANGIDMTDSGKWSLFKALTADQKQKFIYNELLKIHTNNVRTEAAKLKLDVSESALIEQAKKNAREAYANFMDVMYEEALANLCANNDALKLGQYHEAAMQAARAYMYDNGLIARGFFENLDKLAPALNGEKPTSQTAGKTGQASAIPAGARAMALDNSQNQDIYADFREDLETGTAPTTNANVTETLTAREQAEVGEGSHESISHSKSTQTAKKNIRLALNSPKVGFENIWNHFKDMKPNDLTVQDEYEIRAFAAALKNELRSRDRTGGRIFNKKLPADTNRLREVWQKAQALAKQAATREGQGLQSQRSTTDNYEKTLNNSAKEFLGVEATDDVLGLIDPDSIGAKMFGITDDHVRYQQSIDDRLEDGVIDMNEALKLKRQELEEVNKIRDVNAVFGPASGKLMAAWEQKAIDRIIKHNTPENAYRIISDMALASVNRIVSDFRSVGAVNTIKQIRYLNMLSNVATIVNNVLNNAESSFTGAFAQNIARATNYMVAKIMDQKGYEVLPKNSNLGWYPGFLPGRKNRELNEYMITKAAESVLSLYYGLDTNNAFVDDSTLAENASKRFDFDVAAKHNQTDDYLGRLLARFQFLSGLGMVTTDEMAIARAYRGMEMNIDEMKNATPEHKAYLKQIAQQTALTQMYHNTDGAMSQVMSKLRDWGNQFHIGDPNNGGSIGLGDIVMPFVNVPANVASRAMRATPIGAVAGMIQYINGMRRLQQQADHFRAAEAVRTKIANKEGLTADDQVTLSKYRNVKMPTDAEIAKVQLKFGESVTNAAITAVGYALAALGAIKDFDDEDDEDLKRIAREKGMTGLQVNISRLWGKDWDDDDVVTIGGSWLEVMAIPITIGYQIWKDVQDPDANALKTIAMSPLSSLNTLLDAAQEVPGIKQVSEIWNAYENLQYEDTLDEKVGKVWASVAQYGANTATTFVIPNLVSQAAAGMDNTVRDVYNADSTKEIARNIFYNKVPGLRQKLPEAKDSEGNVRKYGENAAMGVLNRMILPGTGIQVYSKSPLQKEWERLIANGADGKGMIPKKSAPSYIELNDKKYDLNAEERRKFDDEYTENTVNLQKQAIEMPEYKALSDEDKEHVLNDISTLTQLVFKKDTLKAKGVEDELNLKSWQSAYIDDTEDLPYYLTAKYSLKSIYDEGEFKDYAKMDEWIKDVWPNLDKAGQDVILNDEAQIDDIYSASKVGIDAETYSKLKETQQKYKDLQDHYRDVDNGPSLTALSRDMIVDYENIVTDKAQRKWAQENLRLWQTLPASNDTLEKWQKETSLTTKEIDSWKDVEEAMKPLGGYKNPSQNQKLMAIRDFNGISARNQKDLEKKRWEMIEMIASKGEDKDGDGVGDGGAWKNLRPYMEQGYSVAYALDHAIYWYKDGRRLVKRKYNTIYPAD